MDAILAAGPLAVRQFQVLYAASVGVGDERCQAASGGGGESQLGAWVRVLGSPDQSHPGWPAAQVGHAGQFDFDDLGALADAAF